MLLLLPFLCAILLASTCRAQGAAVAHEDNSIAFLLYDLGEDSTPHAALAARSLFSVGQWNGRVAIVTGCQAFEVSVSSTKQNLQHHAEWQRHLQNLVIKHLPEGTATATALRHSHYARVAQAFRFVPADISTLIVLEKDVYVGASLHEFLAFLRQTIQALPKDAAAPKSFLMAFQAKNGWSTSVTVIHRMMSTSCLRACQTQSAKHLSSNPDPRIHLRSEQARADALEKPWTIWTDQHSPAAEYREPACVLQPIAPEFYRDMSRFDILLKRTAPFLHVFQQQSAGGLYISQEEHDRYLARTLNLGSDFVEALYKARHDCFESPIVWNDIKEKNAMPPSGPTTVAPQHHGVHRGLTPQVPHIALGGFAKCATTTLYEWLIRHPNIMEPWTKEPNFDFASYETAVGQAYLDQLLYGQRHGTEPLIGPNNTPMLSIDASTHLLWNMTHVTNLKQRNPNAKIIAVACHPTERLISHWNYRRFVWEWEFLEGKSFDEIVQRQLREMPSWVASADYSVSPVTKLNFELDGDDSQGVWQMVREGLYELALERVEQVFDRQNILVVLKEDIRDRPLEVIRTVEAFLGVPHHGHFDELEQQQSRHNVNKHQKETLAAPVLAQLNAFYKKHNEAFGIRLKRKLPW
eukprot:m.229535 g.229535  ORF g.229535 m.229535 type:complete len:636 (+) comp17053_c0_seq10:94-2001(+)